VAPAEGEDAQLATASATASAMAVLLMVRPAYRRSGPGAV